MCINNNCCCLKNKLNIIFTLIDDLLYYCLTYDKLTTSLKSIWIVNSMVQCQTVEGSNMESPIHIHSSNSSYRTTCVPWKCQKNKIIICHFHLGEFWIGMPGLLYSTNGCRRNKNIGGPLLLLVFWFMYIYYIFKNIYLHWDNYFYCIVQLTCVFSD